MFAGSSSSLRARLIQLVLVALLPALGLIVYSAREQRRHATELAENEALRLARILSASHQRLIDSTGYLLVALARVPEIRQQERAACTEFLSDLIEEYPPYSTLAVAGRDGEILCQSQPGKRLTNAAEKTYFRHAIEERELSIGEYQIGRNSGNALIHLAYPIIDDGGVIKGVVFAAANLARFNEMVLAAELPKNSTLTLFDRDGRVLSRYPHAIAWVGREAADSPIFKLVARDGEGVAEAAGLDGVKRLYGFTSFGTSSGKRDIYLSVGIPLDVALASAHWNLVTNLAALLLVSILALAAAWYVGAALILRPLSALWKATARVAAGKLSTRTGLPHGDDELGRLAAAFDQMAENLEREEGEARTANLRTQQSLERIKALHEIELAIASSLELPKILEVLLDKIDLILPNGVTNIMLMDRESGDCVPVASRNLDGAYSTTVNQEQLHCDLTRQVLETRLPVTAFNLQKNSLASSNGFIRGLGLISYIGLPLIAKGELLGAMSFYTKEEHVFDHEEKDFLVTLSGQLAVAIHNSRLYDETKRSANEITVLHALTLAANQSLDLDLVLQEAIKKISEIFQFTVIRVFLFNESMDSVDIRAAYEKEPRSWAGLHSFKLGEGIIGRVAATGESLIFEDVLADPRYTELSQTKTVRNVGSRFAAFLPIKTKLKIWGTILCAGEQPRRLKANEVRLLESMTNQIGIAVENSSLYQQTAARAQELASLYSIAAIAGESLDLDVVLQTTMAKVLEIFSFDAARIYLCKRGSGELHLAASRGFSPEARVMETYRPGEFSIGKALESGEPVFVEGVTDALECAEITGDRTMFDLGFQSWFTVPLKLRGIGLGVMNFLKRQPYRFTEGDRQLIHSIAYHLGIAVGNANLYTEIKEKTRELQMANKAKDEFLGVMSHELRTPLNVIKGYADITRDETFGALNPEQKYSLDKISAHANELAHMINSILQVTRIEADTVAVDWTEVDPCDVLRELETDYLVRADKDLQIVWDYPRQLPLLRTDDEKLRAVLQNLVNNALKFTEAGSITISARHAAEAQALEFKVTDTGGGIEQEKLPLIFDMFKQADSSPTRRHEGVGLGLYIVKKFVDLLGGRISVQSKVGVGSTFVVSFPLHGTETESKRFAAQHS